MESFKILPNPDFEAARPFLFASQQNVLERNGLVWLAFGDGAPCGALGAAPEDGALSVLSLFVDGPFRRRGAAAALLDAAESAARSMGLPVLTVQFSCTAEEAEPLHRFFLRCGFSAPLRGDTLLLASMASLEKSRLAALPDPSPAEAARITPLRGLSPSARADCQSRIGHSIPEPLSLRSLPGKALPGLCLAYEDGGRVRALLRASDAEGRLHLGGLYLESPDDGPALIALLKTFLRTAQTRYPQYETLSAAAGGAGGALLERLLQGAAVTRRTACMAARPVRRERLPMPAGFGGVMVRLNTVSAALTARGVPFRLVMGDGAMPYLELEAGNGLLAELHYHAHGGEAYTGFRLGAAVTIDAGALTPEQREAVCTEADGAGPAVVYVPDWLPGRILVHGVWEEPAQLDTDAAVDGAILPYLAQARLCASLAAKGGAPKSPESRTP